MEEKNLTDEEIVKALEMDCLCVVYGGCESCPLFDKDCKSLPKAIKELIHRLQSENAEYKQKIEDGELVSKDWHDEQVGHAELVIAEQKAEIERLTEEKKTLVWLNKGLEEAYDEVVDKHDKLLDKNAELQKQVDELKGDEIAYETRIKNLKDSYEQAIKDTAKEIYEKVRPLVIMKNEKFTNGNPLIAEANKWYRNKFNEIFKPYGVEVE